MKSTHITRLVSHSLDLIEGLQSSSGAFPACPTFKVYQYSWLRDGTYIAAALARGGRASSAQAFHEWVVSVVVRMAPQIRTVVTQREAGHAPRHEDMLPTRYCLDGTVEVSDGDDDWPNVQLDGYGIWLWGVEDFLGGRALPAGWAEAVKLAADYLTATWDVPCYDCWEEFGERRHTSTAGAIAAGLYAAGRLLQEDTYGQVADRIKAWILESGMSDGTLVKGPEDARVDASLLSLAVPLGVLTADDPVMMRTADRISHELVSASGGVWRYLGDTYYGGGAWILLTCWLGLQELALGETAAAQARLEWCVQHASADLDLPEQVVEDAQTPEMVDPWVKKWGQPASPLLWSHAMFVILALALEEN